MKSPSGRKPKGVRPMSLHISDKVTKALRCGKIPKTQLPATGVVAQTKQVSRGDYQCNLPMQIHSRFIRPLKSKFQQPIIPITTTISPEGGDEPKGKKEKKVKAPPPANTVFTIASTPHIFDPHNESSLPDTAHDLAYHTLSQLIDTQGVNITNPNANNKNSSDFMPVQDAMFQGVSVAPQGFLGLKLNNKYISKRLVPFLVQNDAPPPLFYESDMKALNPENSLQLHYDDRPLSLVPDSANNTAHPIPLPSYPRVVTIDYSSPNIAKEMHVGHIRSTCIGNSLAKLLEFSGCTIQRVNHLGDWGTQFGMLLCHYNDMKASGRDLSSVDVSDLAIFYREAKQRFDKEPNFAKDAKEYVVKLQGGDQSCISVWKEFCGLSRPSFQNIFSRLQIDPRLLERGESFYQPFLNDVIDELLTAGVAIERDGAVLLPPASFFEESSQAAGDHSGVADCSQQQQQQPDGSSQKQPKAKQTIKPSLDDAGEDGEDSDSGADNELIADAIVLRKSDGGFAYGATDMAAIRLRLLGATDCWYNVDKHQPDWYLTDDRYKDGLEATLPTDWALYVVDSGQSVHFSNVFAGAQRAGWIKRAQNIAQERKVNYFNDIIQTMTDPETTAQLATTKTKHNSIVRVTADGDQRDFVQDTTNIISPNDASSGLHNNSATSLEKPDLRVEHVQFGVVCGADGKRLRTRAGQQIKLVDLLDESVSRSKAMINQITTATSTSADAVDTTSPSAARKAYRHQLLSQPEIVQQLAESVGYASIKYADLSKNRVTDYIFDFDTMLDMTGDTAGYLLYAHARLFSILQRVGSKSEGNARYNTNISKLLAHRDPFGHFDRLIDYDYQHLQTNSSSQYESLLDVMLHHPDLMQDFIGKDSSDDQQQALLVSSALAQYQSEYALDTNSINYPRRHHHNDDLWLTTTQSAPGIPKSRQKQHQRINPAYLDSVIHNVSTIDPVYGISYASPVDKTQTQVYHKFPTIALDHPSERQLGLHIVQFHDAITASITGLTPHTMAGYTYDLSTAFSNFYRDCTVNLKDDAENNSKTAITKIGTKNEFNTQDSRALLTHSSAVTLERCLDLIGIQPTKFM